MAVPRSYSVLTAAERQGLASDDPAYAAVRARLQTLPLPADPTPTDSAAPAP